MLKILKNIVLYNKKRRKNGNRTIIIKSKRFLHIRRK